MVRPLLRLTFPARLVRLLLLILLVVASVDAAALNESNPEETVIEVTLRVHARGHYSALNASALTTTLADVVCDVLALGGAEAAPPGVAAPPSADALPTAESATPEVPEGLRVELVPGMYLGSKTPYSPAESPDVLEVMPLHCKLVSGWS